MKGFEMDNEQKIIIETLQAHTDTWTTVKGLKAILADCIPEKRALRNILCYAYEEGIVDAFQNKTDLRQFKYRYSKKLQDDYAVADKQADWAIETWIYILSVEEGNNKNDDNFAKGQITVNDEKLEKMKVALVQCAHDIDLKKNTRLITQNFIRQMKRILDND